MKHKKLLAFSILVAAVLMLFVVAHAQSPNAPAYQLLASIVPPGGLAGFDIAWVDPGSRRFYLADRTATKGTGRIDVVNTVNNALLYTIPTSTTAIGFAGATPKRSQGGPAGILVIPETNQLWAGDGNSTVKVVDLAAKAVVAIIPTGGSFRADELAYDPVDRIIMITNPDETDNVFVTFISTDTLSVLGRYTYPASQTDGSIEQPLWNPLDGQFYISVPHSGNGVGGIDRFDPIKMIPDHSKNTPSIPTLSCDPRGLAITPFQHLMSACGVIADARSGNVLATITGTDGTDEVWYNPGDNRYYFGRASNIAVVDAERQQLLTYLGPGGHSIAVDPNNNHVFAPTTPGVVSQCPTGCIQVFGVK